MRERTYIFLVVIVLFAIFAAWLDFGDPHIKLGPIDRDIKTHLGLDLVGGLRVLLQLDLPAGTQATADNLDVSRTIVEKRVNALGVSEPLIQTQGTDRISVELPGISNPDQAIQAFGSTGLLEFVDAGDTPPAEGDTVQTTGKTTDNSCSGVVASSNTAPAAAATLVPTAAPTLSASATITTTGAVTATPQVTNTRVFTTVMTGDCLSSASVTFDNTNKPIISFSLADKGSKIFGDFTTANVRKYLAIVLDKKVISAPVINSAITGGSGIIQGSFTLDSAKTLAIQLKYGSLPIPLKIIETTDIGATLGQDALTKSKVAGAIGLLAVVLFMLLNYRFPGVLASMALTVYALVTFAIFKGGIPLWFDYVTLTLPGIAGFILSVGMAVDANILIFERMKEELRAGRPLTMAIEAGFGRAWPSIRDSNISTLITCVILYLFGTSYGASIVAGFALTLAIGVVISLFTAVLVTRTFLRLAIDLNITQNLWWFGVSPEDVHGRQVASPTR
ncbi:MAG: protein translocase subunit SecD [Anaerolineae bacterium]